MNNWGNEFVFRNYNRSSKLFYDNFWEEISKKATKLEGVEEIFRIFHDLGWLQYIFFFVWTFLIFEVP